MKLDKYDALIKPISCTGACFGGYKGMDTCGRCDGTGSQLTVRNKEGKMRYFPNTKEGNDDARKVAKEAIG